MRWSTSGSRASNLTTSILRRWLPIVHSTSVTYICSAWRRTQGIRTFRLMQIKIRDSWIHQGQTVSRKCPTQISFCSDLATSTSWSWISNRWSCSTRRTSGTRLIWSSTGKSKGFPFTSMEWRKVLSRSSCWELWPKITQMHWVCMVCRQAALQSSGTCKCAKLCV